MKAPPGRNLAERRALREAEAKIRRGLDPARSRTFAAINTVLPILGALAVVAIMVDLLTIQKNAGEGFKIPKELQSVMLESTGEPYVDAGGLFSIVPPKGWNVIMSPRSDPYNAVLEGPNGVSISILAAPVTFNTADELTKSLRDRERESGLATDFQAIYFKKRPAVQRIAQLHTSKIMVVDFVENRVHHHILCSTPPNRFDQYRAALMEVLNTYEPAPPRR